MSDAITNVAAAFETAQARKAARPAKAKAGAANAANPARQARIDNFARINRARPVITFETAARIIPTHEQVGNIIRAFGLDDVDYHAIREATEASVAAMGKALQPVLVTTGFDGSENTKGFEMHMQRIVGAFVGSAYGAATFYENKRDQARELSSKFNADRDEDRMGVDGLANRAQRAREFAASLGVKAYGTLAAADGALGAYAELIGSPWKPYEGTQDNGAQVAKEAAASQAAALGI